MLREAAEALRETVVDDRFKGVPLGASLRLAELGEQAWNVSKGDLTLPATTLSASALASNLATMQAYCERNGVLLAPHGKTTMSPQLFARQFHHGAWALTAGTPTQAAVMRRFGVPRIILANELADEQALRWFAAEQDADNGFQFLCLVDDAGTVAVMDEVLRSAGVRRPVGVFLEVGIPQGRCGVRTVEDGLSVARAVYGSPRLALVGVEAYEGPVASGGSPEDIEALDAFFALMSDVTVAVDDANLFETDTVYVTAGGSAYFDRVVAGLSHLRTRDTGTPTRVVLRSGCYISHDNGKYEQLSPLAGRAPQGEPLRLRNALTAWASVLSRPEPNLVVLGTGKRDVAFDLDNPAPRSLHRRDGSRDDLTSTSIFKLMDQHAFLRVDPNMAIAPGDIVAMDLSHPCTAFDKFKLIPLIDDDHQVVDGVLTFF